MPPKFRFTERANRRKPSAIRKLIPLTQIPGMISLAGGMPNPSTFPITDFSFKFHGTEIQIAGKDLDTALQYCPSQGIPALTARLGEFVKRNHSPPYAPAIVAGTGSADLVAKILDLFVAEDDVLLVEAPTYSGSLAAARALACNTISIEQDQEGIIPEQLESVLNAYGEKVKLLVTIPTGQNPCGQTASQSRRQQIYSIASKYDIPILEDDPYYHLYYGAQPQPRSYMSMDVDQRVIRTDSFSKILSSGMRFGFASGPQEVIDKLTLDMQATCMHSSAVTQMMILKILQAVGDEGFEKHIEGVQRFYQSQRDALVKAVDTHLGDSLVSYTVPQAGMFLWLTLLNQTDSDELISTKAQKELVLLVPGKEFYPELHGSSRIVNTVRAAFSLATPEQFQEAMKRLAKLLRENPGK